MKAADPLQAYYAARAAEYDRIYRKPERQQDLRALERWLPEVFRGRQLLELCCGTGYWTQFLAPAAARITAVDASIETLQVARSRGIAGDVDFAVGDAYRLPCAAQAFDAAFAGFWWSHIPRARARGFLHGLHGALRPGATVVFLDNRYVPGSSTPIAETDADGNSYQLRRLDDGSTHRVLKNFPTQEDLHAVLADVAHAVRWHAWPHYWAVEYQVR